MSEDLVKSGQIVSQIGTGVMAVTGGLSALLLLSNMRNEDEMLTKLYLTSAMSGVGVGLAVTGVGNAISTRNDLSNKEALDVSGRILLGVGLPVFAAGSFFRGSTKSFMLGSSVLLLTAGGVCLGISQNADV
jgi:hypothetical protein